MMPNDSEYWKLFYSKNSNDKRLLDPSLFCKFILDHFKNSKNLNILDAGCGTGRDAMELAKTHNVVGVDLIQHTDNQNFTFEQADFCTFNKENFDVIYSRFTYHTISNVQQDIFLDSIKHKTTLCMEFRSDKSQDILLHFGKTHFRNFINLEHFKNKIKNRFEIIYLKEDKGFAPFGEEDPICIRTILRKK